ncbi:MAG: hypothetical protein ACE5PV_05395 [Candidatus Poribacteria bacterium]
MDDGIIRLLLAMVPQQRGHILREEGILYQSEQDNNSQFDTTIDWEKLNNLLQNIPLPDL